MGLKKHLIETKTRLENLPQGHKFGLMSMSEKIALYDLARQLPENSTIVETGTYLGSSASIMSSSNPTAEIFSFDLFDNHEYDERHSIFLKNALGENKSRSIENVRILLSEFTNIHLNANIDDNFYWNCYIDLYLEDGDHRDPWLGKNLNFWLPWVKVGGFVLLHDYRPNLPIGARLRFPDVEGHVNRLMQTGSFELIILIGSLVIFKKIK